MVAFSKPMKPIETNEPPPLIQKMDKDILKAMLKHKLKTIAMFIEHHPNSSKCCDGVCDHTKYGKLVKKITVEGNSISYVECDEYEGCLYIMPIIGHLIDYELFDSFLLPEEKDETPKRRADHVAK